jgi:uncharacterized protein
MRLLKRLFSKEDRYLHLLEASAEEGRASVRALQQVLQPNAAQKALDEILRARDRERQICTEIHVLLCQGEPPSLAREDVECLARALCRIPKGVKKFAERYGLCAAYVRDVSFTQQLSMLQTATETLYQMAIDLRSGSRLTATKLHNETLQRIEGEADDLLVTSLGELYHGHHDFLKAVMLKDLYELLERVFDRCRNAGNALLQVSLKQS